MAVLQSMEMIDWFELLLLFVFLVMIITKSISLRIREGINPVTLRLAKGRLLGLAEIGSFLGTNLFALLCVLHSLKVGEAEMTWLFAAPMSPTTIMQAIGVMLSLAAFTLFFLALRDLGLSWRLGVDDRSPGELVTTGVYAYTRNPVYIFFNLWFFGTFLIKGSLVFLILTILMVAILHYQIRHEESFLLGAYGSSYAAYCSKTPRYFSLARLFQGLRQRSLLIVKSPGD